MQVFVVVDDVFKHELSNLCDKYRDFSVMNYAYATNFKGVL